MLSPIKDDVPGEVMVSVVRFTTVMIIVTVAQAIVTVARTILNMMNRVNLMITLMCTGLLDWMSMVCVGIFMDRVTVGRGVRLRVMPVWCHSDSYENVVVLLRTGSDQPMNCVFGAAYPGIPCEEETRPGPSPVS